MNPHYYDADPASTRKSETRDERISQFLEENDTPVVALREVAMLRVDRVTATVRGSGGGRVFRRGEPIKELTTGDRLDLLHWIA